MPRERGCSTTDLDQVPTDVFEPGVQASRPLLIADVCILKKRSSIAKMPRTANPPPQQKIGVPG